MKLQDLNNDCLEHIFKFLKLEKQFMVMRLQYNRFNEIIGSIWRRTCKFNVNVECNTDSKAHQWPMIEGNEYNKIFHFNNQQDLFLCMSFMPQLVYRLILKQAKQLDCLENLILPRVTYLDLTLKRNIPKQINFSQMFPSVESLRIDWENDGLVCESNDINQWQLSQSLFNLSFSKTIVELTLVEDLMQLVIKQVVTGLPSLHRITVTAARNPSPLLLSQIALFWKPTQEVHALTFNFVTSGYDVSLNAIFQFKNTTRLYLLGGLNTMEYYRVHLARILTELTKLREIHYGYDASVNDVSVSDDLKRSLTYDFVIFTAFIIKQEVLNNRRKQSLELNCFGPELPNFFNSGMFNAPHLLHLSFYEEEPFSFPSYHQNYTFQCDAEDLDSIE